MSIQRFAIDFDSLNTNLYKVGSGLVLSEPTVAAVREDVKLEIKAIGNEAKRLTGKTAKNVKIVFPVFESEIVNEKVASGVLDGFLIKAEAKKPFSPCHVLFALPCGYSQELVQKYLNVSKNCGISKVYFAESPVLSALGQQIPLNDSNPCFVIDMAGGTTNIGAVSLDGIIAGISVNYGENKIYADIIDYVAEYYGLQIGLLTAEKLKKEIGSLEDGDMLSTVVNGRDTTTGAPRSVSLKAVDIMEPIKKYYDKIAEISLQVLKKLPPEVSAEIRHSGIYVSGCASTVYGLEKYYLSKFNIPVKISDNGQYSVALGGGMVMGNPSLLKKITVEL